MNKYEVIRKLINQNLNIATFGSFGEGVSDEWILKAQNRLNIIFPPSYTWWLKNYGGGEILGDEIFSIYELDFDNVVGGDIVYINELDRKKNYSKENELIIQKNDFGEVYFIDLNQSNDDGEYPIYNKVTNNKYADDFLDFLIKKIKGI